MYKQATVEELKSLAEKLYDKVSEPLRNQVAKVREENDKLRARVTNLSVRMSASEAKANRALEEAMRARKDLLAEIARREAKG